MSISSRCCGWQTRRARALESHLRTRLLERGTSGLTLTQEGAELQRCSGPLLAEIISGRHAETWVLHAARRLQPTKVTAFVQFVRTAFPDQRL